MSAAKWSIDPRSVKYSVTADGTASLSYTLLDAGTPQATITTTVTAARALEVMVHGEPGMTLTNFQAWSDF